MDNEDIRDQIQMLRNEMRALGSSFASVRADDVRNVLGEQARTFQRERTARFFEQLQKERRYGRSEIQCRSDLERLIDQNFFTFEQQGRSASLIELDDYVHNRHVELSKDYSPECSKFAEDLFDQLRSYYEISDRMYQTPGSKWMETRPSTVQVRSKEVEEALAPLANSWRIEMLSALKDEDYGLSELGRKVGLQKGHAQFHIKALVASGYMSYDRKSRLYSITPKGKEAYEGAMALVEKLRSA